MKWSIPERVIEYGRDYMREGRVLSIEQDIKQKVWHAEVLGTELYYVTLDGTAKENDRCECPYWLEHGYCKHTVAVELALKQQGISRVINQEHPVAMSKRSVSISEMFTKGFGKLIQKNDQKTDNPPLVIEYAIDVIETNNYYPELAILGIMLRIGYQGSKQKTYIVKNIGDFLQTVLNEGVYAVNKQQQFELSKEVFPKETKELLSKLAGIYHTNQLVGVTGLQSKGKMDKRYLLLPIDQSEELLNNMLATNHFILSDGNHNYRSLVFSQDKLPIYFKVTKKDTMYKLSIENNITIFLAHYQWAISKNYIYSITQRQQTIYTTMQQLLKRVELPEIIYSQHELSELFGTVLPLLREIGTIEIDEDVQSEVVHYPLKVRVVFKKSKGKIKTRVDFLYGELVFSSDPSQSTFSKAKKQVVREEIKEQKVKDLFQTFGYEKTAIGYEKKLPVAEDLYYFFKKEIPAFRLLGDVFIGSKLRELFLDAQHHQPTIEVSDTDSWLDVHFDVTGIDENEIDAVLASLLRNDQFYTLETGAVLALDSDEFQQTSQILTKLRNAIKSEHGTVQLPRNQGVMLETLLEDNVHVAFSSSFKKMVADLTHPEKFPALLPKEINATLRSYQIDGFKWLKMLSQYGFGGILADEMGLGKTVQMITYLLSEKQEKNQGAALIVAPASLIYNWVAEIRKFAPTLRAEVIAGNKIERRKLMENRELDILITSYASLRQDIASYQQRQLGYLILDEAQMVKNSATKTAQALKSLTVSQRFALSGTPVENNLDELWSIFQLILPGLFPTKKAFRTMKAEEIAKIIQPFILRRDKKSVLSDLPDKIETNLYSVLTEEQKTVYLAYLKQMQQDVSQMDQVTFKKNRLSILAGLTRLRQICCDPRLFIKDYTGGSGKLEQVKDMIIAAKENKRRVLLFSQFTSMLSIIEQELNELGLSTFYLRGSTKPKERLDMSDAFNQGERDVFLISLKAGGTGLNLTGADTVILYDLWWNPAVEEQAAGRAHRIGQKKVVEVWRMIAEGTVEEKMNALQQEKRELFQKVIQGNEEQLAKMTEADIRMILSIGE